MAAKKEQKVIQNSEKSYIFEIFIAVLILKGVFLFLSLISYSGHDASYTNVVFSKYEEASENLFGKFGAYAADFLGTWFGWSALFIPISIAITVFMLISYKSDKVSLLRLIVVLISTNIFICTMSVLSGLIGGYDLYFYQKAAGGILGVVGATFIASFVGRVGGIILSIFILLLSFMGITRITVGDVIKRFNAIISFIRDRRNDDNVDHVEEAIIEEPKEPSFISKSYAWIKTSAFALIKTDSEKIENVNRRETLNDVDFNKENDNSPIQNYNNALDQKQVNHQQLPVKVEHDNDGISAFQISTAISTLTLDSDFTQSQDINSGTDFEEYDNLDEFSTDEPMSVTQWEEMILKQESTLNKNSDTDYVLSAPNIAQLYEIKKETNEVNNIVFSLSDNGYEIPFSLLNESVATVNAATPDELQFKADLLINKLKEFKVDGRVTEIRPGPVVTLFEVEPARGVKISQISNLENDLALAMSALSIRIITRIPGKSVVGIEIPNTVRESFGIRELLEAKEFKQLKSPLAVVLGKDTAGKPYYADLRAMPHVLVAGTTGSGKSVCINALICSILYKSSPDLVKFVMVDPKMVELSMYDGIPHLIAPVVTDAKKAAAVLNNVVKEMEDRYLKLTGYKVRGIESYNELAKSNPDIEPMPYLVVIVDEFADLMMVAGKEVETSIARIAQKARAIGIHLVLATQRPSANVITGIIKANMPSRLSFKVSSTLESRIILDSKGAEQLLGRGDGLFMPPGTSDITRIHGCYVDEKEVNKIVEHLKMYGEPEYKMELMEGDVDDAASNSNQDLDPMYEEALEYVRQKGEVSISGLQRYLKIGYNRSANIVDSMEKNKIITPSDGTSKPRKYIGG